jgi:hypothetical protein
MKQPFSLPKWLVIIIMVIGALILLAILAKFVVYIKGDRVQRTVSVSHNYGIGEGVAVRSQVLGPTIGGTGIPMMDDAIDEMKYEMEDTIAPSMPGGSAAVDLDGNDVTPRIIKTGDLRLRVEDASTAMDTVQTIVSGKNGFVESSSISDSGEGPRTARMTLRIPVSSFEETLTALKDISVLVLHESTGGQDVTTEFVDLEANLRNARAEEESYRAILNRSGSIEEVLMVTRQLAEVRGRIERLEARQRYLENKTDLATLQVMLTEETRIEVPTRKWKPFEVVRKSVQELIQGLQAFVDFLIRFVIAVVGLLIPVAAFVGLIMWLGWKVIRWFLRKLKR